MLLNTNGIYRFDEFELDPAGRVLTRHGITVPVSSKAFQVLSYLVMNPGRVITKDELLKGVWPESFVEESNLPVYISVLRKALTDRAGCIATVSGLGYQFTARVQAESHPQPPDPPSPAPAIQMQAVHQTTHVLIRETSMPVPALPASKPPLRLSAVWVSVALGLLLSVGTAYAVWRYMHRVEAPPLVVVSEFENTTGDPQLDRVLDSALQVDLQQSPYLSFLSDAKIRDTLKHMEWPATAPLSAEVAREVCQRNNAQVLLRGVVAKFGRHFLLTLKAVDCQSGDSLAQSKSEASVADDIPHAIDLVAADMRKRLGESRASIRQFNTPLFPETTNSLEALQHYSEGSRAQLQGKCGDATALYNRAIELDPKFAMAYANLAACYRDLSERWLEGANLAKAYELRDSVAEQDRLYITARYNEAVTGDLRASMANFQLWTSIYPRDPVPWRELANVHIQLGDAELAVTAARKSLALNPADAGTYVYLVRALLHAGHLDEAKAVCDQAIAKGVAGGDLHSMAIEVAIARHDPAGIQQQLDWAAGTSEPSRIKLNQEEIAFLHGQAHLAQQLVAAVADDFRRHGLPALATRYILSSTRVLAEEGDTKEAKQVLDKTTFLPGLSDCVVALAEVGEPERAAGLLKQELAEHPRDTLWTEYRGPQIEAAVLLAGHKPQAALEALSHAAALDYHDYHTLLMRGNIYLELKQPDLAALEFGKILDRPGLDSLSYKYPLAQLGLARALAAQKNVPDSLAAYQTFFTMWKDADPDLPVLLQARRDYAQLRVVSRAE
jgi:DNA-binding winged helix-turn-helix (wHTH) protein/tetratricopeptide (TPR) repeat protein